VRSRIVFSVVFSAFSAVLLSACSQRADPRQFTLQGQVISIAPDRQQATLKHEDIQGLMPAMTMPYKVKDRRLLDGIVPGDLIQATLVIVTNDAYLTTLRKTGSAPIEKPTAESVTASSGFELLKPGEPVPDTRFVDQDGRKRGFGSFRGQTVVLTFIYTRCPMPTFCPLMDRHFAALQHRIKADRALNGRIHLVTVSFDPATDTPPVLKKHAAELQADPRSWTFLTGDRDEVDQFASRFGMSVARALTDQRDITHNLRTAVISPDGTLVKVYTGNDWTPDQLLDDLR
jgi:protein SCO1/2